MANNGLGKSVSEFLALANSEGKAVSSQLATAHAGLVSQDVKAVSNFLLNFAGQGGFVRHSHKYTNVFFTIQVLS